MTKKDILEENRQLNKILDEYYQKVIRLEDAWVKDETIQEDGSLRPSISNTVKRAADAEAEVKRLTKKLEDCREAIIKEWLPGKDYIKTDECVEIYLHFTIHRVFFREYHDGTLYSEGYRSLNNPTIFKEDKITHPTLHFYAEEIKERGKNGSKIK